MQPKELELEILNIKHFFCITFINRSCWFHTFLKNGWDNISYGGIWLVLVAFGFSLEKNLRNLKPLGEGLEAKPWL